MSNLKKRVNSFVTITNYPDILSTKEADCIYKKYGGRVKGIREEDVKKKGPCAQIRKLSGAHGPASLRGS